MSQATPSQSQPRERHGTCHLTLTINGTDYRVTPLTIPPGTFEARRAWRLRKLADGTVYDVEAIDGGFACTCADACWRRNQLDPAGCKHARALVALGLLPQLEPAHPERGDSLC
jgi:hypothetical protein